MLTVLSAGLPISANNILTDAMNKVFDGAIAVQELTEDKLRSMVRLSNRSVEIVLVVLDDKSSDICKDIEGGLYKSDKYYNYTSNKELVNFLNNKYGLSIVFEEDKEELEELEEVVTLNESIEIGYYIDKIKIKEDIIRSLECRIKELTELYGLVDGYVGVSEEELKELRSDKDILNNKIEDLELLSESRNVKIGELESLIGSLKEGKVNLENRLKEVSKNLDEVVLERDELKVSYSRHLNEIRMKDIEISELRDKQGDIDSLMSEVSTLKDLVSDKDSRISDLLVSLQGKENEVEYLKKYEGLDEKLNDANSTINSLLEDNESLKKDIENKERVINELSDSEEGYTSKISKLEKDVEEYKNRIKRDDNSLFELNRENLELHNKVNMLEKSVGADSNVDIYINEIQELQSKLSDMASNVFNSIGTFASPNGVVNTRILGKGYNFKNIRFAFAGSSESRKGAYKCLLDELKHKSDEKYLVVDLVSETSIDYVFKVKRVKQGIGWFKNGGDISSYISSTELSNTDVLATGVGYVNDSYFLCIDWISRLQELENSGYNVILFCGDISNIVGRVLHESFASCGNSIIYVLGNASSSRTIVTNLRGLSNKKDSIVAYFDFNPAIQRFYEMVSESNECRVLSNKNRK